MMTIIPGFIDRLPTKVAAMLELLRSNDLAALQRVVHDLVGTAGGYGFAPVTQPARTLEQAIRARDALESITAMTMSLIEVIRGIEGYDESEASKS